MFSDEHICLLIYEIYKIKCLNETTENLFVGYFINVDHPKILKILNTFNGIDGY